MTTGADLYGAYVMVAFMVVVAVMMGAALVVEAWRGRR